MLLWVLQLNKIRSFIKAKENYFSIIKNLFKIKYVKIFKENLDDKSNYWLQTAILEPKNIRQKETIIKYCISKGVYVRPSWTLLSKLKPYLKSPKMNLNGALEIEKRIINLPSSQSIILRNKR